MSESESEQVEGSGSESVRTPWNGRHERLKLALPLLAFALGLYVLPSILQPAKQDMPLSELKVPAEQAPTDQAERQFRAWAREQQNYAKTLRPPVDPGDEAVEVEQAPSTAHARPLAAPAMPEPQPASPKQAQAQPAPSSKARPKLAPKMPPKAAAKGTVKRAPLPEPAARQAQHPQSPELADDLAGLKRLEAGELPQAQALPGLEGLSKGRTIDELSRALEALPEAGKLESLKYFLSRLRGMGLGDASLSGWAFVRDCHTGLPVPGFSARIQTPAFDVHYGLFFNGRGPGQFRIEPIDPELAGADLACPPPRGFDPMLERHRI